MRECCDLIILSRGELMEWHAPLPVDMVAMINILRKDKEENPEDDY